ncbi:MAG: hypothetical protein IIC80_12655 [Chloroflexi bacterium]|nr:hypothetical protein [Chloroflexota bacterium]
MATYKDTERQTVEIGGLRFEIMHRSLQDDGGPTIEVYGDIDGESTQVLRFDCFRKAPHYHMPPSSPEILKLDPATVGDGLDWSMAQIREHIPEMLATAGFMKLSRAVDREALAAGWTQVRDAVAATAPVA